MGICNNDFLATKAVRRKVAKRFMEMMMQLLNTSSNNVKINRKFCCFSQRLCIPPFKWWAAKES